MANFDYISLTPTVVFEFNFFGSPLLAEDFLLDYACSWRGL